MKRVLSTEPFSTGKSPSRIPTNIVRGHVVLETGELRGPHGGGRRIDGVVRALQGARNGGVVFQRGKRVSRFGTEPRLVVRRACGDRAALACGRFQSAGRVLVLSIRRRSFETYIEPGAHRWMGSIGCKSRTLCVVS